MIVVTAAEMRRLDRWTIERGGTPGAVLMERAGVGAAALLLERVAAARAGKVVVVAGKGNNGGDGFVMAHALRRAKVGVEVVLLAAVDDLTGDARAAMERFRRGRGRIVEVTSDAAVAELPGHLGAAAVVVDAVFGTGLNARVSGRHAKAIEAINGCGRTVFAVDIPSGLDADRGVPLGVAVRASLTATFGFLKFGLATYPGLEHAGEVEVVDIGIGAEALAAVRPQGSLTSRADAAVLVPSRPPAAHKGTCGHVVVVAGSIGHTGAARLAARAAVRGGAGLTTLAGPASLNPVFCQGGDEWMTAPLSDTGGRIRFSAAELTRVLANKSAVVLGPGLGTHPEAVRAVRFILRKATVPVVCDADALTCLAADLEALRKAQVPVILTPHPGEMGRLVGSDTAAVQADRVGAAKHFAAAYGCVLVLKGARTLVAGPGCGVHVNPTGNPGMASGGMGDALAGLTGALLAQGLDALSAARLAVFVHGDAADRVALRRGTIGLLASDVIEEIPPTFHGLERERSAAAAAVVG